MLVSLDPHAGAMRFMDAARLTLAGHTVWTTRSGYTGEDGFELSVHAEEVGALAQRLHDDAGVAPVGLGARDSLRLEAGSAFTGRTWTGGRIGHRGAHLGHAEGAPARRRSGGRLPGAEAVFAVLAEGPAQCRVGLRPLGRAPMRAGVQLFAREEDDEAVGRVTSGGFGPTVSAPVAMGYVARDMAVTGMRLWGEVRGKRLAVSVASLPFVAPGFKR